MQNNSILNTIAEETNVSLNHVIKYSNILNEIPCVCDGTKEQFFNCLYLLICLRKKSPGPCDSDKFKYILSESLFNTYKDDAIPYLSQYYILLNEDIINQTEKKPQ